MIAAEYVLVQSASKSAPRPLTTALPKAEERNHDAAICCSRPDKKSLIVFTTHQITQKDQRWSSSHRTLPEDGSQRMRFLLPRSRPACFRATCVAAPLFVRNPVILVAWRSRRLWWPRRLRSFWKLRLLREFGQTRQLRKTEGASAFLTQFPHHALSGLIERYSMTDPQWRGQPADLPPAFLASPGNSPEPRRGCRPAS